MAFKEVKKKLGFGCMRLPMKGEEVDIEQFKVMVDCFIDNGFNYFDTAHIYIGGKSELAMRESLVQRHPRHEYLIANKLSNIFKSEDELEGIFKMQLEAMGVDYFDFYLMHAQSATSYAKYIRCHAYDFARKLKKEGKIKHLGLSFHDKAEVLDKILTEQPDMEFVQIQFNYLDYNSLSVESKKCYDVCVKHHKPVIIMEPVKGGQLVNLPDYIQKRFDEINKAQGSNYSNASFAIRFAANFDNVFMVLSGMSNIEQMEDNVSYMKDYQRLNEKELEALDKVVEDFKKLDLIPCTGCAYCVDGCPMKIRIPALMNVLNNAIIFPNIDSKNNYQRTLRYSNKAGSCIKCGKCENSCPQHLPIRALLEDISQKYDNE